MKFKFKMGPRTIERMNKQNRLIDLFQEEHGGCDQHTCDMSRAFSAGFPLWAIKLFAKTGAASSEFVKIYDTLPKSFHEEAEQERIYFCEIEHVECPHCNAIIWEPEYVTTGGQVYCDSCNMSHGEDLRAIVQRIAKKTSELKPKGV